MRCVERVWCSDLLGAPDEDRASIAMLYYGYLAAKAGIRIIDVSRIACRRMIRVVYRRQLASAHPNIGGTS